jgi:hypothetical protein
MAVERSLALELAITRHMKFLQPYQRPSLARIKRQSQALESSVPDRMHALALSGAEA